MEERHSYHKSTATLSPPTANGQAQSVFAVEKSVCLTALSPAEFKRPAACHRAAPIGKFLFNLH